MIHICIKVSFQLGFLRLQTLPKHAQAGVDIPYGLPQRWTRKVFTDMGLGRLDDNESNSCPKHMVYFPVQGLSMFLSYQVEGIPRLSGQHSAWPGYFAVACSRRLPDPCPRRADRGMDNSKSTSPACASNHEENSCYRCFLVIIHSIGPALAQFEPEVGGWKQRPAYPRNVALCSNAEERDPQGEQADAPDARHTIATPNTLLCKTSSHKIHRLSSTKNFYTTLERVQ